MTKRKGIFDVDADFSAFKQVNNSIKEGKTPSVTKGRELDSVMDIIVQQMKVSGYRERTLTDYIRYMTQFRQVTNVKYLEEITTDTIYLWLDSMQVSNQTKLTRLKCLKAILSKCFKNGWFSSKFWHGINIKVDKKVKKGAKEDDVMVLLSLLDLNTYIGLRDAVAVLTLYKTGVRINTLGQLQEKHVDFDNKLLCMDGTVLKNHKLLKLPVDDELLHLLKVLIQQNNKIREYYGQKNSYLFISYKGTSLNTKSTNNAISKQLNKYAKKFGLNNINPHALRRGYAKSLLNKGANLALISKALGHSNLAVTTQYLDLDVEEVADNLRDYL
ncbi:integrase [Alkalihalobacillus alcalophilus ATCC 27647 = CGMCC 1.3604]|uniref:Integrase n=1 Tax=Alkalihalobacillus alcalophilus ATCC 27647 = CGMCC 1.3604 TaxID=1218173 RepID=A0A094WK23_ALKAL|nr:site-specific integrase [Alkalihalobacillus alcalophilus]KGA98124.1 integrase [Alkalihalobacillus alcalophilus ATCC 27647 = CGMCC 1.3604]MED1561464.1 site-specific integrase [Alkalihalobacillus alcalophilus]THG89294.1 integrase [Alkalihalobacillus alcalophilus ATCC 27647 = CGMCC 1.3604]